MEEIQFPISKDSRYATVMVIARRARQLMREAQDKGVNPWEISLAKGGMHKAIKLAEEEVTQGMVGFKVREIIPAQVEKKLPEATEEPSENIPEDTPSDTQEEKAQDAPQDETQDADG